MQRSSWPDGAPSASHWRTALVFVIACALGAESIELARLHGGGSVPPGWVVRAALFGAYGLIAALCYGVAALVSRRRALPIAATAFALCAALPWLNFSFLPRFWTWWSLLGNGTVIAVAVLLVPLLTRWRRVTLAAIALLAIVVNLAPRAAREGTALPVRVAAPAGAPPPFNIVVVLIDTLRADHLGAYGYAQPTSPNFDRLARDGVLFEHATAQAAWTKPSVASLMTGLLVHNHGVAYNRDALGTPHATLAEALRGRGYHTAAFSANPWIAPEFRFDRGFDEFETVQEMGSRLLNLYRLLRHIDRAAVRQGVPLNLSDWLFWADAAGTANAERDRRLTDAAVAWIERRPDTPYFLYVHMIGAHGPYDPPTDFVRPFREPNWDGVVGPTNPPRRVQTIFETAEPLAEAERRALIAQYDGAIAFVDAQLGRIVEALRQTDQLDRTLVVVASDHGDEFYEHRNWGHGNQLYRELLHVPLLLRLPGRLPAARRDDPAMLVDVFPSIIDLVGDIVPDGPRDGRALFAATDVKSPTVFAEHWWMDGGTYVSRMVQQGSMKLCDTRDDAVGRKRTELYDLRADPGEQQNLLENSGTVSEETVGELKGLLARFGDEMVPSAAAVDIDQSTRERLHQLGY